MIAFLFSLCTAGPLDWLRDYSDTPLQNLIMENLKVIPDVSMAEERLRQSSLLAAQRRSGFLPTVGLGVSSNTQPRDALGFGFGLSSLGNIPGMPVEEEEEDEETELFTSGSVALQLSVPLDIWGGSVQSYRSALDEQQAIEHDKDTVLLNLSINIAERYYDIVAANKRIDVVKEQIKLTNDFLTITEFRHQRSEATTLDILQQRQQLANIEAQLPRAEYGVQVAEQLVRLLLGKSQDASISVGTDFFEVTPFTKEQLLSIRMKRPDIQAAQLRVEGAKKAEYSSMTNMLPRISLGGQLSRQFTHSSKSDEWDNIDVYAISTSVSIPIFQGGALWNGYQVARSGRTMSELALQQTKLRAEQSVSQQIENELLTQKLYEQAQKQLTAAEQAFVEASRLYREGLTLSLNLISSQQSLAQAKLNIIQCQRDRISARMQTYAAFGGISLESSQ